MCHTGGFLVWHFFSRRLAGLRLIDVRHANQRLIQLLDILRIDLDLNLITGDKSLSGGSQVLAIPVNSLDDTTLGEGEVIYLLPVEIGTCHDLYEQAGTPFGTEGWSRDHLVLENHVKGLYL